MLIVHHFGVKEFFYLKIFLQNFKKSIKFFFSDCCIFFLADASAFVPVRFNLFLRPHYLHGVNPIPAGGGRGRYLHSLKLACNFQQPHFAPKKNFLYGRVGFTIPGSRVHLSI